MKSIARLLVLAATSAALVAGAQAQTATPEQRAAAKEKLQSMTPAERAAAKEKMKAKWDAMTPEEQAAAKKQLAEKRPRLAERLAKKQAAAASSPQ